MVSTIHPRGGGAEIADGHPHSFYETQNPLSCSLLRPNSAVTDRYMQLDEAYRILGRKQNVSTRRLDDVIKALDAGPGSAGNATVLPPAGFLAAARQAVGLVQDVEAFSANPDPSAQDSTSPFADSESLLMVVRKVSSR